MTRDYADYYSATVEEFHEVMWRLDDGVARDDIIDPLLKVLGNPLPPAQVLREIDEAKILQLRDEFRSWLEIDGLESGHVREALARLLVRWPS